MRTTAIPEHPDVTRERKRERWAVVFAIGGIIIFFGIIEVVFASYAKYVVWKGREMPPDVQAGISQEFTVGYWLIGIGVVVTVAAYVVWLYLRRRARQAYEL